MRTSARKPGATSKTSALDAAMASKSLNAFGAIPACASSANRWEAAPFIATAPAVLAPAAATPRMKSRRVEVSLP